jgi:hypothetical protein
VPLDNTNIGSRTLERDRSAEHESPLLRGPGMAVNLHVRPRDEPLSWEQFCAVTGPFAVALDGYVASGPRFDPHGPRVNFNHHEEVDRLATRSTCAQVLLALRQGFYECFRDESGVRADVYCNDCDEDVCLAWFLLKYGDFAEHALNPALNRLVSIEDLLDSTTGAYPFPADLPALREMAWIFQPYRELRHSGELDRLDAEAQRSVIDTVERRILQYLHGEGGSLPLDLRYERIGGGPGWAMIREIGFQARTGVFADGTRAYVSVRHRPDGRWAYTVGRMSPFIPFDVPRILQALTEAEADPAARWGGGNTVGGSPRVRGSGLSPEEVAAIVNRVVTSNGERGTGNGE